MGGIEPPAGWAHPRSRGENPASYPEERPMVGSSPLTRGKPGVASIQFYDGGLIPAHAGKTHWTDVQRASRAAHPRSRGENTSWLKRMVTCAGSSPLTRGKQWADEEYQLGIRLIPAHAGKTRGQARLHGVRAAHPRSRGENPISSGGRSWPTWLIPAHAGKTSLTSRACPVVPAHPRSRGENFVGAFC